MFPTEASRPPASLHTLNAPRLVARKGSQSLFIKQLSRWVKFSLQKTSLRGAEEVPLRVWRALHWEKARTLPPNPMALGLDPGLVGEVGGRQMVS